ncbi:MAG: hypothetical protein H7239_06235 [Flavobacterium sp.]|nr:hypothetical protein [Flavobacterium sp.]
MLLILLSWCYIIFSSIIFGYIFDKTIATNSSNFVVKSIIGLFFITIISSVWAFFFRINVAFHFILFILNSMIFARYFREITGIFKNFYSDFKQLIVPLKLYLILISVLILAQCSTAPFIIDNESYYIQTIKWLNEYGLVPGLGNLHFFFAQTSGWHVLQSVFNFSFLYQKFNDLSGYCLLLGTIFAVFKLNSYFKNSNKNYLIIGLLPIANLYFFQFINAPSPDLAVYILTIILFYYSIQFTKDKILHQFNLLTILVLFILYIKPISVVLLLIPASLFLSNFKQLIKKIIPSLILSLIVFIVFITKNTILTGYPIYPFTKLSFNLDFQIPKEVISFLFKKSTRFSFFISEPDLANLSTFEIIKKWFFISKINLLLNSISLAIFIITPYFICKFFNKKAVWFLYLVSIAQFVLLLFSVPQYRFFIHLSLFFGLIILSTIIFSKKNIILLLYFSTFPIITILFFQVEFNSLTSNKLISKNTVFAWSTFVFPNQNSKYSGNFETIKIGNLTYNSPVDNSFFWRTSNGNLPCVNKNQIDYFETYFKIIPQRRTKNLKDGFYDKNLN